MEPTSDVAATWAWGLKRYAWIVALAVVGLGVLVPLVRSGTSSVYEAQSQVGPTKPLIIPNLDPLPRFAQSVFTNGAVARDVRRLLRLPPGAGVIPGTVTLTAPLDNPVLVVSAKGASPASAAAVANKAAATFVVELNKYSGSVGTFAVQADAVPPAKPAPRLVGGYVAVVVGILAGLVAGCGAVGLLMVLRRPVVGAGAAEAATGLPVLGTVRLPRKGPPDADARVSIAALSRRLLASGQDVVYVAGPGQRQVDRISTAVQEFLAGAGDARHRQDPTGRQEDVAGMPGTLPTPEIVVLETSALHDWIATPDRSLTLLVVPEGIRARSLRRLSEQHASGGAAALVLVAVHRRGTGVASKRSRRPALSSQLPTAR